MDDSAYFSNPGTSAVAGLAKGVNQALKFYLANKMQSDQQSDTADDQAESTHDAYRPLMEQIWPGKQDADYRKMAKNPEALKSAIQYAVQYQDAQGKMAATKVAGAQKDQEKQAAVSDKEDKRQDALLQTHLTNLNQVRGDQSLIRSEAQRDGAITAFNTLENIRKDNRQPNSFEYYDLLGQLWKARTGAAPTEQALKDLDAKTFQGDLGKVATYFTGTPQGATTKSAAQALQNFVYQSGKQADQLHDGYMGSRLTVAPDLEYSRRQILQQAVKNARGRSFKEATGIQEFNTPEEADAAKLSPGTRVSIGGRLGTVQ